MPPYLRNNFHMLCKAQSSRIEWIVCLSIFMSLVFLSLARQNDINYFSFWPKAKIGKISPFSPLHASPSIFPSLPPSLTGTRSFTHRAIYGNHLNSKRG